MLKCRFPQEMQETADLCRNLFFVHVVCPLCRASFIVRRRLGNPPAWHRVLPGPSGPEPQKSPKRVRKGAPGPPAPRSARVPKSAPRSPKRVPKTQLRTLFGLFSDSGAHSLGTLGLARNRRAFRLPGEGGDHFHCTVEPSPGHIRCR